MAVEVKVPEVGESITEVEIGSWLKAVGDGVERDEDLVTIETDKATVEVLAPQSGTLSQILKESGETAQVGEVIAYMEPGTAAARSEDAAKTSRRETAPKAAPRRARKEPAPAQQEAPGDKTATARPPDDLPEAISGGDVAEPEWPEEHRTPLPVTAAQAPAEPDNTPPPSTPAATAAAEGAAVSRPAILRGAPGERAAARDTRQSETGRRETAVPMTQLRRRLAQRLVQAQQTAALLTTFNELDMSAVNALRRAHQEDFTSTHGVKLGLMSFFVKAAVDALKALPEVNAEIRDTDIIYRNYIDMGVAVGGGRGLVVPVLRDVERMSFADVEKAIGDFARRAAENKLKPDELQGGTFTISNGGVYGSLLSTPIVNAPQSAILGMHAIQERPVARGGEVVVRPMMYVALTYDHRIIDGREAVTFLKRIKTSIEDPMRMLLEV